MKKILLFTLAILSVCAILIGCGGTAASMPGSVTSSEPTSVVESVASTESASVASSQVDSDSDVDAFDTDDLTPIYASQIKDGTYAIEVSSSSSMFKIVDAQLTVAGDEMIAVITLSGTGYEKLYMGTGDEALADGDDMCIYFVEDAEGAYTYAVPVEALDMELDVAAWSIRKQQWYDRVCVFQSGLIPADAISSN